MKRGEQVVRGTQGRHDTLSTATNLDHSRATAMFEVDGEDLPHLLHRVIQDLDVHVLPGHVRPEHQLCNHNTATSPVAFAPC